MRVLRASAVVVLVATLTGCPDNPTDDGGGSGGGGTPGPGPVDPVVYRVPDEQCPDGWSGLSVTTDNDAEVDYLDDIPACTNLAGDKTYLKNQTDAVWVLRATSANRGVATSESPSLAEQSFVAIATENYGGRAIFVPGAKLEVNLPPEQVEWVIDVPLSFGWQAHEVGADKIASLGEAAVVAALKRQTRAGGALAVCTLAVTSYAETVDGIEEADPTEILVDGLGAGVSGRRCYSEAAAVSVADESGRSVTLADDLDRLRVQTDVLDNVHVKLTYVQRASKAVQLGLKFIVRR